MAHQFNIKVYRPLQSRPIKSNHLLKLLTVTAFQLTQPNFRESNFLQLIIPQFLAFICLNFSHFLPCYNIINQLGKEMLIKTNHKNQLRSITRSSSLLFHLSFLLLLASVSICGPVLDNNQIIFEMSGTTTYIPDSGGLSRTGYRLKIGYSGKQWLGVEIVTDTNKNDVLILQINQFYTQGSTPLRTGHEVTVSDYYRSGDGLVSDVNNEYDISAFTYVETKDYYIDMVRYMGSNSGQDWNAASNGYSLTQVCFYTSQKLFAPDTWNSGKTQCYFFEIDNYISSFKGAKLKSFYLNGYATGIYGWIDGPYVNDNVYIYHKVPLFTYTKEPAVVIELGTTTGQLGQDFNVYSPIASERGDYFGASVTSMLKDNSQIGGFDNNGLSVKHWNAVPATQISGLSFTALRISYKRNINTFDDFDRQLKSTFIFCVYIYAVGTINSDLTDKTCEVVELGYHYVRTTMPEKSWQFFITVNLIMMGLLLIHI